MISFTNVAKFYENGATSVALEEINLKINAGEFVTLVGKSGAGKSTLVKLIIGEEQPSRGKVVVAGQNVGTMRASDLPTLRRKLGVVFQDFRLLPKKTVHENVAFAMEVAGRPEREIAEVVPQVLDMVGLADRARHFPGQLSGGEKQRVAIARAMINRPMVIIADEPTGNLDPVNTWEIIKLLTKINELGTTIILATHSKDIVNALGKRVVSIDKGKVVRDEHNGRYILN
ncbi:cell division ATP-binding protein FtsE [Candidatus Kaiserbacteria bacterium RIFCSPHIGHO2_01_FULL_48_10]|uniref:Cell division ATP-binding protein FtsE n=1 Tax=Candidatus Kaiserbacteria bacterium RIFCSPHIGHO2_01_FULL_48_10 TaxID=1798476 RepID=A0A1F6C2Y1_9BACT|nr:MAG: cell division ATP-binding protein FtsE [Candidatus Kaiserbacteria bacterium RIFCSPHIGHO2_01_FULL_48_10]